MVGALLLMGCEPAVGTIVNASDLAIFVTFGADTPRIYVVAGQSITSNYPRPSGPVTIFSSGSGRMRCAQVGAAWRKDVWRVMVTGTSDAMTCFVY